MGILGVILVSKQDQLVTLCYIFQLQTARSMPKNWKGKGKHRHLTDPPDLDVGRLLRRDPVEAAEQEIKNRMQIRL